MTALIRQLLDFARPRPLHKATINVANMAGRVCELVATIAKKANVTLVPPAAADSDVAMRVEVDEGQLHQVLTNLVVNAIQASPDGGSVEIVTRVVEHAAPPYVGHQAPRWLAIEVRDTGIGMDDETRARIFEPFFTTKQVGEGTGLGLSVTWGIVREHGGWIDVTSTPGKGSTFTVYLPAGGVA
jgi:signal transduction histidine kinase